MRGFANRAEAGRLLAGELLPYAGRGDVSIFALPRGGVPVAFEIARALRAPMDVFLVRKLGAPGREELAMGAIAEGGVRVINQTVVDAFHIPESFIEAAAAREQAEIEAQARRFRGDRPRLPIRDRTALLVDDGLATGATMRASVRAARKERPARIIVAVPVAPPEACSEMRAEAEVVVCGLMPSDFASVGGWYEDFEQVSDEEVRELLDSSAAFGAVEAGHSG